MYIGIDMGTSSIKGILTDENGQILARSKVQTNLLNPKEGYFEVDAEHTWWDGFIKTLKILSANHDLKKVRALCVSSMCGTFVPVDCDFNPVYHAILYGIDTRAVQQIERLNRFVKRNNLTERLGGLFNTHSVIPKILWLRENEKAVYEKTFKFVEANNFITSRLTGVTAWDLPTAAGTTLIDQTTLSLPLDVLEKFELNEAKIPPFKWPMEILGCLSTKAARQTGLPEGIPVMTGACDINAEALACQSVEPGDMVVVFGSTVSILYTLDRYECLAGFKSGPSVIEGTYRLGAATSSGGRFVDWTKRLVKEELILDLEDEPTGLIFLPYIDGARTPYNNPNAKGVLFGLRKETTSIEVVKASIESLGYELNLLIEKMHAVQPVGDTIHVLGGLSSNNLILQIIANITNKTLFAHQQVDAAYGDCLMAMTTERNYHEVIKLKGVLNSRKNSVKITPKRIRSDRYEPFAKQFKKVYESLKDCF